MGLVDRLSFPVSPTHYARQISLEKDRLALGKLARRCIHYLRLALGRNIPLRAAPGIFLQMLRPTRVPQEHSFVMGIYEQSFPGPAGGDPLRGILYFLHPPDGSPAWYITLLLLEPSVRGRGLGTEVHRAFILWATARGGKRFVVAVAENNPRGLHFWRDRMGYREAPGLPSAPGSKTPSNRNLERYSEDSTLRKILS